MSGAARLTSSLGDRYAMQREVGAGGMATVYLAEDVSQHREVAIKVLPPELSAVLEPERFLTGVRVRRLDRTEVTLVTVRRGPPRRRLATARAGDFLAAGRGLRRVLRGL
jgi:hypothetical protein